MEGRKGNKVMATVKEVIEALKKWPEDAVVMLEGCDCTGEASGVISDYHTDSSIRYTDPIYKAIAVLIEREYDSGVR